MVVEDVTGPALAAGLQAGDVVLGVNGAGVATVADLKREVARAGHSVALLIQREDAQIYIPDRHTDVVLARSGLIAGVQTATPLFSSVNANVAGVHAGAVPADHARRNGRARLGSSATSSSSPAMPTWIIPSFGMAIIGRVLEAQGFKVGIIAQPDWHSTRGFRGAWARRACSSA